ncbi:MAG TPA: knotted carbamoyltransferase YgeW, partial [Candidatus Ozemobacteraceae bacterium]|nr:knotted carbamoyltransferase YgeW [Candidatus Ozemobacteraceae bacterium]
MFGKDFLLTWEKSTDELKQILAIANLLKGMREQNISARVFDSGLAVSLFRDNSTRT